MRRLRLLLLGLAASALVFSAGGKSARSQTTAPTSVSARGPAPEIEAAVRALVRDRALEEAQIGVVVMDVDTGEVLAQSGEHLVLNPASNAKLYTAAAALALLKPSHRFQTTLSGTVKDGGVSSLVLRGHGDPSLRTRDLWQLALDLKARGVRRVDGDLFVDQKFFDEQTTPPAFEQQPNEWAVFRAPVSAVALNGNSVTLSVRPTSSGQPANAWFDPPGFVDVDGSVKTGDDGADAVVLALSPSGGRLSARLAGTIGQDAKLVRYTRRVDDPRLLAGVALRWILEEQGIKVRGDVKLGRGERGPVLAVHASEPLSTLLYRVGKNSDNFYAEMILKSLAAHAKARPGKSHEGAELVTAWLAKNALGDTGLVIKNGSGLFDSNRTTTSSVAKLLRHCWQDPTLKNEFVAQLAVGGVDGTLEKRFRSTRARRAIRAKTGTLNDAIALSGYVFGPPDKSTLAFSVVFNNVAGRAGSARLAADKLVELLYERQWK